MGVALGSGDGEGEGEVPGVAVGVGLGEAAEEDESLSSHALIANARTAKPITFFMIINPLPIWRNNVIGVRRVARILPTRSGVSQIVVSVQMTIIPHLRPHTIA